MIFPNQKNLAIVYEITRLSSCVGISDQARPNRTGKVTNGASLGSWALFISKEAEREGLDAGRSASQIATL